MCQDIFAEVPSRLKPTDLPPDWEGLDPPVSLTDAQTVGELVKRIAKATGLELHCEVRYAELPIYVRGTTARARHSTCIHACRRQNRTM